MAEITELSNNQKIVADLKVVIADAEEILHATAGASGEKADELRLSIGNRLIGAKRRLAEAEAALREKTKVAAGAADQCVSKHPWQSVGIAAAVGILVGIALVRN
jgi:ElaB/YqjD/DUF883 family membrane-anchored ribosome-binding protein